jgi:predicted CXXCH cytochrome family protein
MLHASMRTMTALSAGLLLATTVEAGLAGSAHDFRHLSLSQDMVCLPCHTTSDTDDAKPPLWRHERSEAQIIPYESPTGSLDATIYNPGAGVTGACLSCHDGTIALEASGSMPRISSASKVGLDLRNSHPVGFVYDSFLATKDGGLHDPATTDSGLGGTIEEDMLINGRMECSSCHDAHDRSGQPNMLIKSNARSALCLTCHNK